MGGLFGGGQTVESRSTSTVDKMAAGLRFQTSAFGLAWTLLFGRNRIAGNLIDYQDFTAIPHTEVQETGGGGGGGGGVGGKGGGGGSGGSSSSSHTSFTYQVALAIGLVAGPVAADALKSLWVGKEKKATSTFTLMIGDMPQAPWSYMVSHHPERALGYHGLVCAVTPAFDLGDSESLANISMELVGLLPYGVSQVGAVPDEIFSYIWSNAFCGLGQDVAKLDDLSDWRDFCLANNWIISPFLSAQEQARDFLSRMIEMTNSDPVWREGLIQIIPRGDSQVIGNSVLWTPDLTPKASLDTDHFLTEKDSYPLKWVGVTPQDAYNHVQVEFLNKDNEYNTETAEYKDEADIEGHGLKTDQTVYKYHEITDKVMAQQVAQNKVNEYLWQSGEYEFQLPWHFGRLDPGDIVNLTDLGLSMSDQPVRITRKTVAVDGCITFKGKPLDPGSATPGTYDVPQGQGYIPALDTDPGDVNPPIIFVPPLALITGEVEVWAAISGGAGWGGCNVYISETGDNYKYIGRVVGPSRYGELTADLPAAASSPDTVNTLSVDLSVSGGTLISGTQQDAENLNTLCKVGDEYLAYKTATLTAQYKYDLTWLVRGAYGSGMSLRANGSVFVRLDSALFKYACKRTDIGKTIYIKCQSFNVYFRQLQDLADVTEYSFTITNPGDEGLAPIQGVSISNDSSSPNSKLNISWNSCPMYDSSGSLYAAGSMGFTLNSAVNGVDGLDAGSLAPSTRYYYWAIANATSQVAATLLSLSLNNPTMPSGYSHKRLLGMVDTDGSGNFVRFNQIDHEWLYDNVQLLSSGSTLQNWVDQDCSSLVPSISTRAAFSIQVVNNNLSASVGFGLRRNGSTASLGQLQGTVLAASNGRADGWCDTDVGQVVELRVDDDVDWELYLTGFYLTI